MNQGEVCVITVTGMVYVDRNAVAVMKEGQIVVHVPFNLSPIISLFLRRDVNKAFC